MHLGLFTMPLHPPGADFTATLKADLDQIVRLDQLGYSEVWIGEHFTSEWENIPAPDLLIAQAIPLTEQIRLGTGVSCIPNHDPFVLAHRIAQLDHMAEGRFNWGVGTGSFPGDMQVFEYWGETPAVNNQSYTRAALDTILKLWTDPSPVSTRAMASVSSSPRRIPTTGCARTFAPTRRRTRRSASPASRRARRR